MARGETILGLWANRAEFLNVRDKRGRRCFVVSAYRTVCADQLRYTSPVNPHKRAGKRVLYRVRVFPKKRPTI